MTVSFWLSALEWRLFITWCWGYSSLVIGRNTGDIREYQPHYSGGVRQSLIKEAKEQNWDTDDIRLNPAIDREDYALELRNATFCLAPSGHGWGIRLVQVGSFLAVASNDICLPSRYLVCINHIRSVGQTCIINHTW
jgi:hypothetical protein